MAVIKLSIYVANLTNVMGLFDKIQVFRSESGVGGPFVPITASAAEPATLTGITTAPFNVNGKTLKLKVNEGVEQEVLFVSPDPVNIDNVVGEINSQLTGVTASDSVSSLKLTSGTTGTAATLEITGGTALAALGFLTGDHSNGKDAHITLVVGVTTYEYDDRSGDPDNYYETRYYNSSSGAVSSFSDPVKGDIGSILPVANLILAKIDLARLNGTPVSDCLVTFYNMYVPPIVISDIGVIGKQISIVTDQAGHAETFLVRGSIVDVTIAGTQIIRQITVPTAGTEFNVMEAIALADDLFQIQVPDMTTAIRRS